MFLFEIDVRTIALCVSFTFLTAEEMVVDTTIRVTWFVSNYARM